MTEWIQDDFCDQSGGEDNGRAGRAGRREGQRAVRAAGEAVVDHEGREEE